MDLQKDFADLCSLLIARQVDFLVVGGYALAFHGAPRFTGDLDLLVRPDAVQVKAMLDAVNEFGFSGSEVSPEYLLSHKKILQLGRVPVQIHIMTNISGLDWDTAWVSREQGAYAGVPVFFLGRGALIANKLAAGRAKDIADVAALKRSTTQP
jgi:hypothetical protein